MYTDVNIGWSAIPHTSTIQPFTQATDIFLRVHYYHTNPMNFTK